MLDTVFVCYCQDDVNWRERFFEFMNPLESAHDFKLWTDQMIKPGDGWLERIMAKIEQSKVAILLVTPGFLASDFIRDKELPLIMKCRKRCHLTVIWVPVVRGIYQVRPELIEVQAAINPERFLHEQSPQQRGISLSKIGDQIVEALNKARNRKRKKRTAEDKARKEKGLVQATPVESVTLELEAHDVARAKRLARREKETLDGFLAETLRAALSHKEMAVTYRHESEIHGGDNVLGSASEARFIALTYKTLGLALTGGKLILPKLRSAELAVYALPILRHWHPTLRGDPDALESEWLNGVTKTLKALLNKNTAPLLETIDLRIINRVPTFTSSLVTNKSKEGELLRIRYTPVLEDVEPVATPTMNLALYSGVAAQPEPVFDAFARVIDNMCTQSRPLVFPVLRKGAVSYARPQIEQFVQRLTSVTNNRQYEVGDVEFEVRAEIDRKLADELQLRCLPTSGVLSIEPGGIYELFDALRASGRESFFSVGFDVAKRQAMIRAGTRKTTDWLKAKVEQLHTIGVFALMTAGAGDSRVVFLKDKRKLQGWPLDVPGGRLGIDDSSPKETLERELFEELGMTPRPDALRTAIAYKYDPRGGLVQAPVIAVYYHYRLTPSELAYVRTVLPNATDGYPLKPLKLDELIRDKKRNRQSGMRVPVRNKDLGAEARCHAPLEALLRIREGR